MENKNLSSGSYGRRPEASSLVWLAIGCALAVVGAAIGGRSLAHRPPSAARAVFEATHLPPLLRLSGEQTRLTYDVHCAPAGVEDPEHGCAVRGVVFLRAQPDEAF